MPFGYQFCRCGAAPSKRNLCTQFVYSHDKRQKYPALLKDERKALEGLSHQLLPFLSELVNHAAMHVSCVGFESGARTMQPVFPGVHLQGGFPQALLRTGRCRWQTKEKNSSTFDPPGVYKLRRVHVMVNEPRGSSQSPVARIAHASALCHLLKGFVLFPPWSRKMGPMVPGKFCLWMCLSAAVANKIKP